MSEENRQLYYYHGDHLGSAQLVTDPEGKIYEQLEYTPYGELWVEHLKTTIEATPFRFTGKERDSETGLYYFGARYLNPQTSMWLSADPAMGEYIPQAPINDEAKQHNKELPGMGGVFNYVNLHAYHYAGNNPIKLTDPDGRSEFYSSVERLNQVEIKIDTKTVLGKLLRNEFGDSVESVITDITITTHLTIGDSDYHVISTETEYSVLEGYKEKLIVDFRSDGSTRSLVFYTVSDELQQKWDHKYGHLYLLNITEGRNSIFPNWFVFQPRLQCIGCRKSIGNGRPIHQPAAIDWRDIFRRIEGHR
jgi:RHS repeat-associated protein